MSTIGWGIDVGVGSLGFAVVELDDKGEPIRLLDGAVETFSASVGASERQTHRSMRTQYGRRSQRMKALRAHLIDLFDLPEHFDAPQRKKGGQKGQDNSRIALRARGLQSALPPEDLAKAILHIAKNRGQRLSRAIAETASSAGNESSTKEAVEAQTGASETGARLAAFGVVMALGRDAHPSELSRCNAAAGKPTRLHKDRPDAPVYTRRMMIAEFDALLARQAHEERYRSVLTPDAIADLRARVFWEAEGKRPAVGKCRFGLRGADGAVEDRLPVGTDLFQTKRIYEEVNNLRLIDPVTGAAKPLDPSQRDTVADAAMAGREIKAGKVRTLLKLGRGRDAAKTSLDIAEGSKTGRKVDGRIQGHQIAAAFAKGKAGAVWAALPDDRREAIAETLRTEDDFEIVCEALQALGLSTEAAQAVANAPVSPARSAAGPTATARILEKLKETVVNAHAATEAAGLTDPTLEIPRLDRLPYYGVVLGDYCVGATFKGHDPLEMRFGRIPNPTVHQSLNRIRKMANGFLKRYGKPARICIELARDLNKSPDERAEDERRAAGNGKINDAYIEKLFEESALAKRRLSRDDLTKLKLHRLQGGRCLYTGKELSVNELFDGSTAVDHILPRATTLDDGLANLALCTARANAHKAKRTPHAAFADGHFGHPYPLILERAKARGPSVFRRFQPDALDRFKDDADFRERFLVDTRYIGKAARRYLSTVCADANGVVAVNGRLTGMLRRHWGLDGLIREIMQDGGALDRDPPRATDPDHAEDIAEQVAKRRERTKKMRLDHRHHLLDAVVAGCTTRRDVQRIATVAARFDRAPTPAEVNAIVAESLAGFHGVGLPWRPEFRAAVKALLTNDPARYAGADRPASRVLRKPDHNVQGALHAASNYRAICRDPADPGTFVVSKHVQLSDFAGGQNPAKDLAAIDDMGRARSILDAAAATGAPRWWGDDPRQALDNLARDLAAMRTEILALKSAAPADAKSEAAKLKWAIAEYSQRKGRRRFTKVSVMSARILKPGPTPDARPLLLAPTKTKNSNHCFDLVRTPDGDFAIRVTARLDANRPGGLALAPGETCIMRLHADDLVEMLDGEEPGAARRIYRLVSFSGTDIEFLPIEEARPVKQVPDGVRTRLTSVKRLLARKPVQVVLDATGRVRWRGAVPN